jgi:hypothetical protein
MTINLLFYRAESDERSNGLLVALTSTVILWPVVKAVNSSFAWLHGPFHDAVVAGIDQDDPNVSLAEPHSRCKTRLPFVGTWCIGLAGVFLVASLSRRMSAETTQQWLMSVCLTLALKWLVQDPLLIFVWSPLRAVIVRHREESKLAAIVHCCCTPFEHRKQHLKVQTVIELQTALRSLHNSILQHHVETALDQDEATSTSIRTNEQRVLVHSNSVRQQLRAKQEHQRLGLERRRRRLSQAMAALIDGVDQPVDVLTRVDLNTPTSTDGSTASRTDQDLQVEQLMQTYRRDAAKLVDQHESAQADARRKLAQRKLQKNRLRSRTSKVVRMNRILVVSQAEMEAGVDLSERSLIDDALQEEERRLAERIAAMELIMVSITLHSCMRAI